LAAEPKRWINVTEPIEPASPLLAGTEPVVVDGWATAWPTADTITVAGEAKGYRSIITRCQEVENPTLVPGSALYGLDAARWVRNLLDIRTHGHRRPR
jgi:hypothetical protein